MIKTLRHLVTVGILGAVLLSTLPLCAETIAQSAEEQANVSLNQPKTASTSKDDRTAQIQQSPTAQPPQAENPRIPLSSRIFAAPSMEQ